MKKLVSKIAGFKNLAGVLFIATIMGGCGSDNSRLRERAQIEGEESAKMAVEAENNNREKLVAEREAELHQQQEVYSALEGYYEGRDSKGYQVRLKISPSLPYYKSNLVRTLDEVTSNIIGLYLKIDISYVDQTDPYNRFKYHFEPVKPDLGKGNISLSNSESPFTYTLFMGNFDTDPNAEAPETSSTKVVRSVLAGINKQVTRIQVKELDAGLNETQFSLDRKGQ